MLSSDARVSLTFLLVAAFSAPWSLPVRGEEPPANDDLVRELEDLREQAQVLLRRIEDGRTEKGGTEQTEEGEPTVEWTPFWGRQELDTASPFRGVYDKPFLVGLWKRAYVGGYTEVEYHSFEDGIQGIPRGFRMHRTNLFLFTDIADRVRFGSELEFETEFDGTGNSSEIEVALEMAFVDWRIFNELTLRGGAILVPLGRINVNHDGPVRELTERPLVSRYVIPSTLTEAGIGAHGFVEPLETLAISYEAYLVNGFNILDANGSLSAAITEKEQLLREGRSSLGGDANDGVATTGRVAVELLRARSSDLGFASQDLQAEIGGSWHVGTYDERGDNFLTIVAADAAVAYGIVSLEGEIALADFSRDAFAMTSGVPDRYWGYYVQAAVGGMPQLLRKSVPVLFDQPGAQVSFALRFDWIDLDGDRGTVIEPGITFRPVSDTVFKFSYRFSPNSFGVRGTPPTEEFDDEGFVFSLATYF